MKSRAHYIFKVKVNYLSRLLFEQGYYESYYQDADAELKTEEAGNSTMFDDEGV